MNNERRCRESIKEFEERQVIIKANLIESEEERLKECLENNITNYFGLANFPDETSENVKIYLSNINKIRDLEKAIEVEENERKDAVDAVEKIYKNLKHKLSGCSEESKVSLIRTAAIIYQTIGRDHRPM